MKAIVPLLLMMAGCLVSQVAASHELSRPSVGFQLAQAKPGRICAQVISCGTKAGQRKEYPTPCAAQDDGATNIAPKTGATCDESK
jgi:hypothetical protein